MNLTCRICAAKCDCRWGDDSVEDEEWTWDALGSHYYSESHGHGTVLLEEDGHIDGEPTIVCRVCGGCCQSIGDTARHWQGLSEDDLARHYAVLRLYTMAKESGDESQEA